MKPNKPLKEEHDHFKLGQGYGSGEKGSDAETHASTRQFGDNPLPESGGNYEEADDAQPSEDPEEIEPVADSGPRGHDHRGKSDEKRA